MITVTKKNFIKESVEEVTPNSWWMAHAQKITFPQIHNCTGYLEPKQVAAHIGFLALDNFQKYDWESNAKQLLQKPALITGSVFFPTFMTTGSLYFWVIFHTSAQEINSKGEGTKDYQML